MKEEIIQSIDNPQQLEKLYRENKAEFKKEFNKLYSEVENTQTVIIWNERLNFENSEISWGAKNELLFVIIVSIIAGITAKMPTVFSLNEEEFFMKNISFVVFPFLSAYFIWKQQLEFKKIMTVASIFLVSVIYVNLLPKNTIADTFILASIHLPLFLWAVLGFSFVGNQYKSFTKRIDFLRYNGNFLVMSAIIFLCCGLFTAVTLGLFSIIGLKIEDFYFKYVAIFGAAAVPIVSTYLVQTNPPLVNKVSPVVAKVFTPLVLTMLLVYLCAIVYSGKDPYNNREFLLVFNMLLIAVMAIILFSIAETTKNSKNVISIIMLFLLSLLTVIVNSIALSAIIFRISSWGFTANRLAVLGGNILILSNLLLITSILYKSIRNKNKLEEVEKSIASFLPMYAVWAGIVTFLFPLLFNFK